MKKIYRRLPGMKEKYLVNGVGDVYDLKLKREIKEKVTRDGRAYYILKYNGQKFRYSRSTLKNMAYGYGKYKNNGKGEIVYIDVEENKVC